MSCGDDLDPELLACDSADFCRRVIQLVPGEELSSGLAVWRDAIVFLAGGEVELVCVEGSRRRFTCGAILGFTPTVRLVRNSGVEPARLIAVSRRGQLPEHSG